ncbi:MAG TPA: plastocyanin/azurin family copper-binding protein [Acidimicrobiales bacterium]|nr:plastocyanin/azurin family copper-binding protein [Acidimicrobiales bacterium]
MRRVLLAALPLVAVLAACGGDDDDAASSEPGVVVVDDNTFKPKTVEVGVGDTVTWRFEGQSAHNVTFEDDEASDLMKDGEYERTFDEAGGFDYVCTVHPGMTGSVKVSDSAAP